MTKLESIAKDLIEYENSKPSTQTPPKTFTGQESSLNRIVETLATDPVAREQLIRAVDPSGSIDFNRIDPNLLDRFRDPAGNIDFQKLKEEAKAFISNVNVPVNPNAGQTFNP